MKRILIGLLAAAVSTLSTMGVEDNNPCDHPNIGHCEIELNKSLTVTVTLVEKEPAEGQDEESLSRYEPVNISSIVRSRVDVKSKTLVCPDCKKNIPCSTSIKSCSPGGSEDQPGTYTGNIEIECNPHHSSQSFGYTVTLRAPGGGPDPGHDHEWSDWSYDCELSGASSNYFRVNSSDPSLKSFILETMNTSKNDDSHRTRSCLVAGCDEVESRSFSHSARWICAESDSITHIYHNDQDDAVTHPGLSNGKHRYCVAMSGSCDAIHYVSTGVWIQQTVNLLEVTSKAGTGQISSDLLPELPDYEPSPSAHYFVRVYKPGEGNQPAEWNTVLEATPNFGSWELNNVTWTRYPLAEIETILLPRGSSDPGVADFRPTSPGTHIVVARCNYDPDNNLPAQAKSVAICVVDPTSSVDFQPLPPGSWDAMLKASGNEKPQKSAVISLTGKTKPIRLILRVNRATLTGQNATLVLDSQEKESYAIFTDVECTQSLLKPGPRHREVSVTLNEIEDDPENLELTLYFLPLLPDEEVVARLEYESSSIDVTEPGEDKVMITGGCSSCVGDCIPLNGDCGLGSIKVNFELGKGLFDLPGGQVNVDSETLDYRVLSPDSFQIVPEGETTITMNDNGYPSEANTGVYRTTFEYSNVVSGNTAFVNRIIMKGYLVGASSPFAEAELELQYTDTATTPSIQSFTVKNTVNGVVRNYKYTRSYQINPDFGNTSADVWTLTRWLGDNVDDAESEFVARQDTGSQRVEYHYIGSISTPLLKEKVTKQKFDDGEYEIIESRIGDAVTTYTYDTNRNLTSITNPDGSSTSYTYNTDQELTSETDVEGNLTTVTTYTTTDNGVQLIKDSERKVNGVLTSKSRIVQNYGVSSSPDLSIQYDENNVAYTTSTYYVTDQTSPFCGRERLIMNPTGTVTIYQYERNGSTETTTIWSGVPNSTTSPTAVTLGTKTVKVTDSLGRLQSIRSWHVENGTETLISEQVNTGFDSFGRVTSTSFLDGSTISRSYGCCGVESETDQNGITTTYAYDDLTKRVSYSVRDGITTLYSYDAAGNQLSITVKGRNGSELSIMNEYDNGKLAATEDVLGNRTTYSQTYTTSAEVVTYTETVTGPDGGTQVMTMVDGSLTGISGTAVHPQSYEYGPNWQKTLPQNQTVYTDMLGRQYKTTYADGNSETQYYNAKQQLVRSVTPAGRTTLYEYDVLGRQVKQAVDMNGNNTIDTDDLVTTTAYSYGTYEGKTVAITVQTRMQGSTSTVISTTRQSVDGLESWTIDMAGLTTHTKLERNGNGSVTQTVFNPDGSKLVTEMQNGRVETVKQFNTDGTAGNVITYSYDEFNRQTGSVETVGGATVNTMTRTLDAAGRPVSETVNGRTTTYAYDIPNRKRTIAQPGNRVVIEEYHPTGELKKLSGADTYTQEWTWDPVWGQKAPLTTWKDASTPQVTTWTYDNRGNLSAKKYADDNGPSYTYDADGNLLTRTWARGVTTTYAYDPAGRITGQEYSDDTTALGLTLDSLDRALAITDASGTWNFTYDPKGWLVKETVPAMVNGEVIHGYDAYGRRTELRTASGSRTFTYDVQNRIASIGNSGGSLHYTYRSGLQQLDTASWRNGEGAELNSRTFAYDSYHRLTGIKLNGVSEVGYTLNDRDQRTAVQYPGISWNYGYDDKGQLTGAEKSAGDVSETYSYTYDGIGNRLTAQESASQFSYTSNLLNQYTQVNTAQPTYDADGNMLTTGDGWTYAWNGENRLVRAEKDGTVVEMNYDFIGRRFEKKVYVNSGAGTSGTLQHHYKYVYDGYKLVELYDNDTLLASFTWQPESVGGLDVPVSMVYEGDTYYYVTDGNKNVTALLDAAGFRVAGYTYGPFGQVLSMDGALAEVNPFRFSSEFHDDETGLVYYNYRYYSPSLGRWTKRDPIGELGGANEYCINQNASINRFDINGLWTGKGLAESYRRKYGEDAFARMLAWLGRGRITCASTWFDDWYVKDNTIYIAATWWLGQERPDDNAAEQLNEALAIHFGIGKTNWLYKAGRTARGAGKMVAGGLTIAGGVAISGGSAGSLTWAGAGLAFVGGNTFVEGASQFLGNDHGGFNPAAEFAYQSTLFLTNNKEYSEYAKMGYYILDFSISIGSAWQSYRAAATLEKGRWTKFHTDLKEGSGVGPLLLYDKNFKPIHKFVITEHYQIKIYGMTLEGTLSGYTASETMGSMMAQ